MIVLNLKPTVMKKWIYCLLAINLFLSCSSNDNPLEPNPTDNQLYFPPLNSDTWETTSVAELGWNESQLQPLIDYLELKNTKSFMIRA